MNERIKELAEQAGYSKEFLAIGLPNNMEKFAELIVKECVTIMTDASGSKLRLSDAIWNTKVHFGVEE
jgi:hypothetical protein